MTLPYATYPTMVGQIKAYSGDDLVLQFVCEQPDPNSLDPGVLIPVDISGLTNWKAQTRPSPKSSEVFDFVVDSSLASEGILVMSLNGSQTKMIEGLTVWGWDVQCLTSDNKVLTFLTGTLSVSADWTR